MSPRTERKRKRKRRESEQIVLALSSSIPGDLVQEILLRLPAESLLRFRCVSKSWYSLLSSKEFVNTHLKNTTIAQTQFLQIPNQQNRVRCSLRLCSLASLYNGTCGMDTEVHDLDDSLTFDGTRIVGYANGLCCIRESKEFILWNPSTRMSTKLPTVYEDRFVRRENIHGFGFDESSNNYNVLAVVASRLHGTCCAFESIFRLYSLRTNSWKTLERFLVGNDFSGSGVLVNGKFHWAGRDGAGSGTCLNIVSFDLGSEAVGSVEQPSFVKGSSLSRALSVLEGYLCVLSRNSITMTDIWVMKEYGVKESWCRLMTVTLAPRPRKPNRMFTPLCISPEGQILLYQGSSSLFIYDPKEKTSRRPWVDKRRFHHVGICKESSVSPFPGAE